MAIVFTPARTLTSRPWGNGVGKVSELGSYPKKSPQLWLSLVQFLRPGSFVSAVRFRQHIRLNGSYAFRSEGNTLPSRSEGPFATWDLSGHQQLSCATSGDAGTGVDVTANQSFTLAVETIEVTAKGQSIAPVKQCPVQLVYIAHGGFQLRSSMSVQANTGDSYFVYRKTDPLTFKVEQFRSPGLLLYLGIQFEN